MISSLEPYLPNLWLGIIAFFLLYYAAADGVDLGVGILTLLNPDADERDTMMGALLSTWHSKQTWLVIVGGMMFGAFPLFYGLLLTALYIPVCAMLLGFIIRGVALDYGGGGFTKASLGTGIWFGNTVYLCCTGMHPRWAPRRNPPR